jgi:hypothetical protein
MMSLYMNIIHFVAVMITCFLLLQQLLIMPTLIFSSNHCLFHFYFHMSNDVLWKYLLFPYWLCLLFFVYYLGLQTYFFKYE